MRDTMIELRDYYYREALRLKIWLRENPDADPEKIKDVQNELVSAQGKNRHFARNFKK